MKKTLACTMILKNELHQLPRLCKDIAGLFDEYHFTDTGSDDGSVEWLTDNAAHYLKTDRVYIHHFGWRDDFAMARNYALQFIDTDYWCWLDCDDSIGNKENFMAWKTEAMALSELWYLPYHYVLDDNGNPQVSFIRERVFKTALGFTFKDFIHEGVDPRPVMENLKRPIQGQAVQSWAIKHLRTQDEAMKKKGRNLSILEKKKDSLSSRLQFYYGKELFDNQRFEESAKVLIEAVKKQDLEQGDRILAFQYLVHALIESKNYGDAIKYGILGIQMAPNRAEYHCLVANAYQFLGMHDSAIPFYAAAKSCINTANNGMSHEFSFGDCYSFFPRMNLAKSYFFMGRFEEAIEELKPILSHKDAQEMHKECLKAIDATTLTDDAKDCDDIVITCPHPPAYPWDEELYKTKGLGGSETAAVEMAMHLKQLTGRQVKVFQQREDSWVSRSGVEYLPAHHLHDYFKKWKPSLHIAWRHAARLTKGRSVVWSHDLLTPGVEQHQNYDKVLALSDFHKTYMMAMQGVPEDKIIVTRNGIEPKRFVGREDKITAKVIWPNSPDRGLEYAIEVMDLVRKEIPEAELHCFYGFDNMKKFGLADKAKQLEEMISTRHWIKYHGNVDQKRLARHFMESEVWLYTASFIETQCISAMESMASQCWPVVRSFGALKNTLGNEEECNRGDIIDIEMGPEAIPVFADKVINAIKEKKWTQMKLDPEKYSWTALAKDWIKLFNLT